MTYASFIAKKVDVALALYSGGCGGGYTEAAMILASLLSGIAADIWPGENIDRKRFVELWSCYAHPTLATNRISVTLLVQSLRKKSEFAKAEKLEASLLKKFGAGYSTRVLIGDEADMSEEEVKKTFVAEADMSEEEVKKLVACVSDKDTETIRSCSYGSLFYEHVRCGAVHEFHLTEDAVEKPMTQRSAGVSYSNQRLIWRRDIQAANNPFAQVADSKVPIESLLMKEDEHETVRLIHFNIQWVTQVVRSITSRLGDLPPTIEKPTKWWIEGR